MKEKVLITGGTGYFGLALIDFYTKNPMNFKLVAGVRDMYKCREKITNKDVDLALFDFYNPKSYESALEGIDRLVLVRPPELKDFRNYIFPLIDTAAAKGVKHIVFLSVANVERNKILPHRRLENHIIDSGVNYTFLRAGFFMQNIHRFHAKEVAVYSRLCVPSGDGRVNFTDMRDVAEAASIVLSTDAYFNDAFELTGNELLNCSQVADILTSILNRKIDFDAITGIKFIRRKRHEKVSIPQIILMGAVYAFIKSGREEFISDDLEKLLGRAPRTVSQYILDTKDQWSVDK